MFDIGFSEILVVLMVALIVIGPEKLPKVARTLGLLTGRLQRYVSNIKADVEREIRNEEVLRLEREAKKTVAQIEGSVSEEINSIHGARGIKPHE